jgi:hypothetical protein
MTYAKSAGLVVGQQYAMREGNEAGYPAGTVVTFKADDRTTTPEFFVPHDLDRDGWNYINVGDVIPVPAKPVEVKPAEYTITFQVKDGTTALAVSRALSNEEINAVFALLNK